ITGEALIARAERCRRAVPRRAPTASTPRRQARGGTERREVETTGRGFHRLANPRSRTPRRGGDGRGGGRGAGGPTRPRRASRPSSSSPCAPSLKRSNVHERSPAALVRVVRAARPASARRSAAPTESASTASTAESAPATAPESAATEPPAAAGPAPAATSAATAPATRDHEQHDEDQEASKDERRGNHSRAPAHIGDRLPRVGGDEGLRDGLGARGDSAANVAPFQARLDELLANVVCLQVGERAFD